MTLALPAMRSILRPPSGGALPVTYATWNPADANPSIILTNGNLTAAATGFGQVVRANASSSGKVYYEIVITTLGAGGGGNGPQAGWATGSCTLNDDLGNNNQSIVPWGDGETYGNNATLGRWMPGFIAPTDIVCSCIDGATGDVWSALGRAGVRGDWNNDPTADPTTGVLPYTVIDAGPYFAAASPVLGVLTARFDPATWSFAAPSGYGPLIV